MKINYKKYIKGFIYMIISILILSLLTDILYYNNVISQDVLKYFKIVIILISCFISGFYIGFNSQSKGYKSGLLFSLIVVLFFLVMGIIYNNLTAQTIIYYLINTFTITFASMIGINKKKY